MSCRRVKEYLKILYTSIKSLMPSHCRLELLVLQPNNRLDKAIILLEDIAFLSSPFSLLLPLTSSHSPLTSHSPHLSSLLTHLTTHLSLTSYLLLTSLAHAVPIVLYGLYCSMASIVQWPLLFNGLYCSMASIVQWPLLFNGLYCSMASIVQQSIV